MYQEMYTHLFNAVTDALAALEAHNYGQAEQLLRCPLDRETPK